MNKRLFKWVITIIGLGCSYAVQADNPLSVDVNLKDAEFTISLPANPTTGFQWQVVNYNKKLITLGKSDFQKPETQLIGAGGTMIFTFILNKKNEFPDSSLIVFKYLRPWEASKGNLKEVTIHFIKK